MLMFCGRAKISFAASKVEFDIEQKVQLDIFEGTFWCLVSLVSQTSGSSKLAKCRFMANSRNEAQADRS